MKRSVTMKIGDVLKVWGGLGFLGVLLFVTGISPKLVLLDVICITIGAGIILWGTLTAIGTIVMAKRQLPEQEQEDLLNTYLTSTDE